MADNVTLNPGTAGDIIAADDIAGVKYQIVKLAFGADGAVTLVEAANGIPVSVATLPLPTSAATEQSVREFSGEMLVVLLRIQRLLESQQVVDAQQRQRITLDAVTTGLALGAVTLTSGTVTSVTSVTAQAGFLGMDREYYINMARATYNSGVRANLNWA